MANSKNITFDQLQAGLSRVKNALDGKANKSHGNHVPATQTANNAKFLRNDNTWQTVTPSNIGAAAASHNHTSLTGVTQLQFAAGSSDSAVMKVTKDSDKTYLNFEMNDDVNSDMYRWRFSAYDPSTSAATNYFNLMTLTAKDASSARLTVNGDVTASSFTGNASSATKLAAARTLTIGNTGKNFDGSANVSWSLSEIGAASSGHTHNYLVSRRSVTAETGTAEPAVCGLSMTEAYDNGYPTTFGNVITLKGQGDGQILVGWSGSSGEHAPVYVRSKRDTPDANWSNWAQFYTSANPQPSVTGNAGTATKLATARTLTVGNTGKSFDGSGNVSWNLSEIGAAAANHSHSNMLIFKSNHTSDWITATSMYGKVNMGGWHGTITDDSKDKGFISFGLDTLAKSLDLIVDGDYYAQENKMVLHEGNYKTYVTPGNIGAASSNHNHDSVYFKKSGGTVSGNLDVTGTFSVGGKKLTINSSAPSSPAVGDIWIKI